MLSRRLRLLVAAVLAVPALAGGAIAASAAPVQPAPTVDWTDPTQGSHLRLGLRLDKGGVTPTLMEIDRGFTSSLRGSDGPFVLRLRDSAGAVLDVLALDDPLALRTYNVKQKAHGTLRLEAADVVVDLPVVDTATTLEVILDRRRIGTVDVGSLIQACQGKRLPCAFS
ncbi:hypothetical protein O7635_20995 [Asanoa sp. WMMD1127]|uniref:hypothetical protein n=1 Tax=Asanoa sp. WMMD1127 TaxID=3016107 RepID=UPI002417081A|nr:hypothetical protein [Asanoa sp. WMMD1127]MDG4824336.1 hypothetical protein [Asanoa sp. WMMD1127]